MKDLPAGAFERQGRVAQVAEKQSHRRDHSGRFIRHDPTRVDVVFGGQSAGYGQDCRRILEQCKDVTVVGEASSGEEGLKKIEELKPHVVFMDLNLPGIGGIDVTRRLKIERPMTKTS